MPLASTCVQTGGKDSSYVLHTTLSCPYCKTGYLRSGEVVGQDQDFDLCHSFELFIVRDEDICAGIKGCCDLDGVESAEDGIVPAKDTGLLCDSRGNLHEIEVLPMFEKLREFPRNFSSPDSMGFGRTSVRVRTDE